MIIFIFGDSITQGYWDEAGGWADRIKSYALKRDVGENFRYYHGVHNLGIDGNTSQQVIDRFNNEVKARLWQNAEYAFIFAVGVNDTVYRQGVDAKADPNKYYDQIEKIYRLASQYSSKIAFVNLLPVNERLTNPLPASSTKKCFTNKQIDLFNSKLEIASKKLGAELIDVRKQYLDYDCKTLLADGLHPNHQGHDLIFKTALPVIESWLYPNSSK